MAQSEYVPVHLRTPSPPQAGSLKQCSAGLHATQKHASEREGRHWHLSSPLVVLDAVHVSIVPKSWQTEFWDCSVA